MEDFVWKLLIAFAILLFGILLISSCEITIEGQGVITEVY